MRLLVVGIHHERPDCVVFVAGTGTDVGKTWVASQLISKFKSFGHFVFARKPVQSYDADGRLDELDAVVLARSSGEDPSQVCSPQRSYEVAMAPPMAARVLDRPPFTLKDLAEELRWPERSETGLASIGVVESAGGVRSPIAEDGDTVDLACQLDPEVVVLVGDAGLGTLNSVRLSVDALKTALGGARGPRGTKTEILVALNRFDVTSELHRLNARWLREVYGLELFVVPGDVDGLVRRILGLISR
jgi:dethiobiotin synthetase